jgi:hypothetical protein
MFDLTWNITIGRGFKLLLLDSVTITRSVEQLADTAEIVLPGSVFNKAIEIEKQIRRGDPVTIEAGYDGNNVTEFSGYLEAIATDDGSIKLKCEDGIYNFRKPVADKQFSNPDVKDLLNYACSQIGGYTLSCDYTFKYDKFVVRNYTGYDILKKIQEECKANVYLKDNVLHVHPQYKEISGFAKYTYQDNIEKSDLEYKIAEDRPYEVTVEGKGTDGKVIRVTSGNKGGDSETIKRDGVSDIASLQALADEVAKRKSYTGYSGSFTGWLIPYCDAGYKISLRDDDYEYKDGDYYVLEVETKVSKSGGERKVKIGAKI